MAGVGMLFGQLVVAVLKLADSLNVHHSLVALRFEVVSVSGNHPVSMQSKCVLNTAGVVLCDVGVCHTCFTGLVDWLWSDTSHDNGLDGQEGVWCCMPSLSGMVPTFVDAPPPFEARVG